MTKTPKTTTKASAPLNALRHHVTGAIERGEKTAITEQEVSAPSEAVREWEATFTGKMKAQKGNAYACSTSVYGKDKEAAIENLKGRFDEISNLKLIEQPTSKLLTHDQL